MLFCAYIDFQRNTFIQTNVETRMWLYFWQTKANLKKNVIFWKWIFDVCVCVQLVSFYFYAKVVEGGIAITVFSCQADVTDFYYLVLLLYLWWRHTRVKERSFVALIWIVCCNIFKVWHDTVLCALTWTHSHDFNSHTQI